MPARSRSSALSRLARTRSVRVSAATRLSRVTTSPASARPGRASGRAETGAPTLTWPTKRSGTRKSTRMCERSSSVAIAVSVSTWSPTSTAEDADPAVEGRADHPALERELGVAHARARPGRRRAAASRSCDRGHRRASGPAPGRARAWRARRRASAAPGRARSPRCRNRARTSGVPRGDEVAGRDLDRGDAAGDVGRHGHRAGGAAVADRRDRVVDRRLDDRGADHPRRPAAGRAPAGRRRPRPPAPRPRRWRCRRARGAPRRPGSGAPRARPPRRARRARSPPASTSSSRPPSAARPRRGRPAAAGRVPDKPGSTLGQADTEHHEAVAGSGSGRRPNRGDRPAEHPPGSATIVIGFGRLRPHIRHAGRDSPTRKRRRSHARPPRRCRRRMPAAAPARPGGICRLRRHLPFHRRRRSAITGSEPEGMGWPSHDLDPPSAQRQDRGHARPGVRQPRDDPRAVPGRRRRLPAQHEPRHPRRHRPAAPADSRRSRRRSAGRSASSPTCRGRSCGAAPSPTGR